MAPKLTVITPVYNAEHLLGEALASLKAQSLGFENLLWMLVDDCSTDEGPRLMAQWARQYPNIRLLKTPQNSGSAAAPRNLALGQVDTPYVMFLDNDDTFAPDACRVLVEAMEQTGADLAGGYFQDVDEAGAPLNERNPSCGRMEDKVLALPEQLDEACAVQSIFWCKIYRTDLIRANAITFPGDTLMEDSVFYAKYLLAARSFAYRDALIYRFRARTGSLSRTGSAAYMLSRAAGYRHLLAVCAGAPVLLRHNLQNVVAHFVPLAFSQEVSPAQRAQLMRAWRAPAQASLDLGLAPADPLEHKLVELCAAGRVDAALAVGDLLALWRQEIGRRDELFLAADRNWKAVCAENQQLRAQLEAKSR